MDPLDLIRKKVLDDIAIADRNAQRFMILNALTEIIMIGAYLLVMDFGDRLHWLILIAAMLVYSNLFIQQRSLASKLDSGTLRILKALQSIKDPHP